MNNKPQRRYRRRKGRTSTYIIFTFLALFFLLLFALPQFYINKIVVTGQRIITTEELVDSAGIELGSHLLSGVKGSIGEMFALRHTDDEKNLLEKLPYLKSIEITSVFPSILNIFIEERIEVAYISIDDGYLIIDADGIALEVLPKQDISGIPVVEGLTAGEISLGKKTTVDKPNYLNQTAVLLNAILTADADTRIENKILTNIKSIRPVGEDLIFMELKLPTVEENISIKIRISSRTEDDMVWLRFAVNQNKLEGLGPGILDLTTSQRVFIPDK